MAIEDTIDALAGKPQKGQTDGVIFEMPNLKDLIAADQYLKAVAASKATNHPISFTQLLPAGAMPGRCGGRIQSGCWGW